MSVIRKIKKASRRRVLRVRKKIVSHCLSTNSVRISVFKSLKYFYVQAIDDAQKATIASASTLDKAIRSNNKDNKIKQAHELGIYFGKKLNEQTVSAVVFDRGKFLYHGRIKAFVEGMRTQGIKI